MLKIQDIAANGYERVVVFRDDCGFFCCIAIHHTKLGPALGGCRIFPYQSEHAALVDALRLSQGMTYKASLAGLNFGGGKCTVGRSPDTRIDAQNWRGHRISRWTLC